MLSRRRSVLVLVLVLWTGGCQWRPGSTESGHGALPSPAAALDRAQIHEVSAGGPPSCQPVLRVSPESHTLTSDDVGLQLLVSQGEFSDGVDPAGVSWKVTPAGVARIDAAGYLEPLGPGDATVQAVYQGRAAAARITIAARTPRPWNFAQDVTPILTRSGCNTGGCHGRLDGQNGFHLSFLGYDPAGDYQAIARDLGSRRLSAFRAEDSLLVGKATGRLPHGGGRRVPPGSAEYHTLVEWIRAGAPERQGRIHGRLLEVTATPPALMLDQPGSRQIRLMARFEDGHERDVTRLAAYRSLDDEMLTATPQGALSLKNRGETDLVVRYQSFVSSLRVGALVNPDLKYDFAARPRANLIDVELFKRLEAIGVPPSDRAGDAVFLRRASLDLIGGQPTPDEIHAYLADHDPDKRTKLVDRLLARPEFVLFWRIKLGDLLQISPQRQGPSAYRYQAWIDQQLKKNERWDKVVRALLTALGDPAALETGGPVNYALDAPEPNVQAELTAQRFLGLRLRCAQCHNHPFDVWTQDDYFGLAACFAKVSRTANMAGRTTVSLDPKGTIAHPRTKQPAQPRLLGGQALSESERGDPRVALAAWITAPDNPYFARATVNWTWAQLFGKGLVDPPDDMSRGNPPVHPELLAALAQKFASGGYDLRDLIRTIAVSEAYALSSAPVKGNERDDRLFSHQRARPLSAHQMADALAQATDVPNRYPGVNPTRRAIEVPDPTTASTILETFGRCARSDVCASTPAPPLSLGQALLLVGGDVVESKVTSLNGYLASAIKLDPTPEELVENLYYRTVCRPPTAEESSRWSAELKQAGSFSQAAEDLFWALLNSREFAFNH